MTTDEAYDSILATQPHILYLTGKTCTGKTTFSDRLRQALGYQVVELDEVVREAVVGPFNLKKVEGDVFNSVYKYADNPEWVDLFVAKARGHIQELLTQGTKVIVDGAIGNVGVVHSIFDGMPDTTFLYFHPGKNSPAYTRNLTARFMGTTPRDRNGLPNTFWGYIDREAFAQFCKDKNLTSQLRHGIASYAEYSHQQSVERMLALRQEFPSLQVIDI